MQQLRARRPNLATDSAPCMRESHILADPSPLVMGAVDCAGHVQQRLFASVLSRSAGICPLLHAEVCHSSLHTALVFAYDCNSAPACVSVCCRLSVPTGPDLGLTVWATIRPMDMCWVRADARYGRCPGVMCVCGGLCIVAAAGAFSSGAFGSGFVAKKIGWDKLREAAGLEVSARAGGASEPASGAPALPSRGRKKVHSKRVQSAGGESDSALGGMWENGGDAL